jgi:protein-tyrosine phosphatase
MLEECVKQGVKNIIFTPHYRKGSYALPASEILKAYDNFTQKIKEKGIQINTAIGREITVHKGMDEGLEQGNFLPLAEGKYILLEFPYEMETDVEEFCYQVRLAGYIPVIAHIERYSYFREVSLVESARKNGAVITVNAASVVKRSYPEENKFVKQLLKKRLVDIVASDYHSDRGNFMAEAYKKVKAKYKEEYADLIFKTNPNHLFASGKKKQ